MFKLRVLIFSYFLIGCAGEYSPAVTSYEDEIPIVYIQLINELDYLSKEEYSKGTLQIESTNENFQLGP